MLSCGIVGLPLSGKTTLFNIVTKAGAEVKPYAGGKTDPNRAVIPVPDARFDKLSEVCHPRKATPATVEFVDLAGLSRDASKGAGLGNSFLSFVAESAALVHVVRCFDNPDVPHSEETIDPVRDWYIVETELILRDLSAIENRLGKLAEKKRPPPAEEVERALLERCRDHLYEERPLREITLSGEDEKALRGFTFLTQKPELVVLNLDETQVTADLTWYDDMEKLASNRGLGFAKVFGRMEMEMAELPPDEQAEFMAELEITEPGRERLIREAYSRLGLISFFTIGKDEVKAWTLRKGGTALEAAGAIHTDLARGFIRAQVVHYDDFETSGFSNAACREKGLLGLEGKEYIVRDGDIIEIRFNV